MLRIANLKRIKQRPVINLVRPFRFHNVHYYLNVRHFFNSREPAPLNAHGSVVSRGIVVSATVCAQSELEATFIELAIGGRNRPQAITADNALAQ